MSDEKVLAADLYRRMFGEEPPTTWIQHLERGLAAYSDGFHHGWNAMMAQKLGLLSFDAATDGDLIGSLMRILQIVETDMTIFYRKLANVKAGMETDDRWFDVLSDAYYDPDHVTVEKKRQITDWIATYLQRTAKDGLCDEERRSRMNRVNPKFVLRNYLAQLAIDKGETGDFAMIGQLLDVLRNPYEEQPEHEDFATKRPEWARHRAGCSMLSCSS